MKPATRARRSSVRNRGLLASIHRAIGTGGVSGPFARVIERWSRVWLLPDLPKSVSVQMNRRLRTSIARWVVSKERLELSSDFLKPNLDHEAILCHELAHAAAIRKFGRRIRPHGPEWRSLVKSAGFEPRSPRSVGRRIRRVEITKPGVRYLHRCQVCHAVRYAKRPMPAWRCTECVQLGLEGTLQITSTLKPGAQS